MIRHPRLDELDAVCPPACEWCDRLATYVCDLCGALMCPAHRTVVQQSADRPTIADIDVCRTHLPKHEPPRLAGPVR